MNKNEVNNDSTAPPPLSDGKNIPNNEKFVIDDDKWSYYEDNEDFLLRFEEVEKKNELINTKYIRFEALNTKLISTEKKMFSTNEQIGFLYEDLKVPKKYSLVTYLAIIFEKASPEFFSNPDNGEIIIKIKDKKFTLKNEDCTDINFYNLNLLKKIKQLESKLKTQKKIYSDENESLKKIKEHLKNELKKIKEDNIKLAKENEKVSKALSNLEKIQNEAIEQLKKYS